MWNIYLKVTIEGKNWCSQNFDFLGLKNLSPGKLLGDSTDTDIIEFSNLLQLKNQRFGSKTVCGFSITLILKGITLF